MMMTKAKEPAGDRDADSLRRPTAAVHNAYSLLQEAVRKSIQVPSDVVVAVTDASHSIAQTGTFADAELETRFWNAYGLLSSVKPVETARRRYKLWFYALLAVLLVCQLYYLAGSLVSKRLVDVEAEWQHIGSSVKPPDGTEAKPDPARQSEAWAELRRRATAQANYALACNLLPFFKEFKVDNAASAPNTSSHHFSKETETFAKNYMKMKGELEVVLLALSAYILPLLYGSLGAFAFILRKLSDPVGKLTYAYDTRVSYTLRVHIGALGGLAVGWFINGNSPLAGLGGAGMSGLVALSPLALAFAAGYASDLLFTALDKVVAAFSPLPSSQTSVKTETTYGGMTVMTETQREARVASAGAFAPIEPAQETTAGVAGGKAPEPGSPATREPRPKAA